MAKTKKRNKTVDVDAHKRAKPGQKKKSVAVKRHRRSTPGKLHTKGGNIPKK
jgi:hypothetical protein